MSSSDAQTENRHGDNREVESLRAKVREFQQIIDALPIYLFYKDDNNKIIDLNVTAAESIGKPIEEIRGRQTEEFFPEADAAKFLKDDREVIASGRPKLKINEQYETGEQGERRHIQTDKIPIRGPSGKLDRLVAIARDTTDEVRTR
ncbi:MAG: PAS domain-containing protein, partial [Phycisphaerales bacterium JB061]